MCVHDFQESFPGLSQMSWPSGLRLLGASLRASCPTLRGPLAAIPSCTLSTSAQPPKHPSEAHSTDCAKEAASDQPSISSNKPWQARHAAEDVSRMAASPACALATYARRLMPISRWRQLTFYSLMCPYPRREPISWPLSSASFGDCAFGSHAKSSPGETAMFRHKGLSPNELRCFPSQFDETRRWSVGFVFGQHRAQLFHSLRCVAG